MPKVKRKVIKIRDNNIKKHMKLREQCNRSVNKKISNYARLVLLIL